MVYLPYTTAFTNYKELNMLKKNIADK